MWKMVKQTGYFFVIVMLLPYIVTVFVNGNGIGLPVSMGGSIPYVTVEHNGEKRNILLDEYGTGLLAKEIDAEMELETIKAQAILIRTSIYKSIKENGSKTVFTDPYWTRSQMKQNWGSKMYGSFYQKMKSAWDETDGMVLIYEGMLALTPYHRLSNGKTRSGNEVFQTTEYPYLVMKDCSIDTESEQAVMSIILPETDLEIVQYDGAGYVTEVKQGETMIKGEEFRDTYHLASASFTFQDYEGKTKVTTKGIGHGLGMSQNYANHLAKENKKYNEILAYFFEMCSIQEVAEIIVLKSE